MQDKHSCDRLSIALLTLVLCGPQRYFALLLSPQNVSCDFRMPTKSMLRFSSSKQMIFVVKRHWEVLILKYSMKGSTHLSFKLQNNTHCPASFISGLHLSEHTANQSSSTALFQMVPGSWECRSAGRSLFHNSGWYRHLVEIQTSSATILLDREDNPLPALVNSALECSCYNNINFPLFTIVFITKMNISIFQKLYEKYYK